MFEKRPEISDTLEWMLQSRQVGDETLVHALVHEHYAAIHQFANSLLDTTDPDTATKLAEQTILEAVEGAHNYRQEIKVQVWLFQNVVALYKRLNPARRFVSSRSQVDRTGESVDASVDHSYLIKNAIDSLEVNNRLTYLLRYYYPDWQCDI
jgi:DNA-directed RNA polymerase specialized sigma24 family protein